MRGCLSAAAAVGLAIAGPALAQASGPGAAFPSVSAAEVAGRLAGACMDRGYTVTGSSAFEVTCRGHLSAGGQLAAQVLLGNGYSTPPEGYLRFAIAQIGPDVRVQGSAWIETTMAYGQRRTQDVTRGKAGKSLELLLGDATRALAAPTPSVGSRPPGE